MKPRRWTAGRSLDGRIQPASPVPRPQANRHHRPASRAAHHLGAEVNAPSEPRQPRRPRDHPVTVKQRDNRITGAVRGRAGPIQRRTGSNHDDSIWCCRWNRLSGHFGSSSISVSPTASAAPTTRVCESSDGKVTPPSPTGFCSRWCQDLSEKDPHSGLRSSPLIRDRAGARQRRLTHLLGWPTMRRCRASCAE